MYTVPIHTGTDGAAVSRDLHHGAARQQIVARHADGALLVELRREVLCHVRLGYALYDRVSGPCPIPSKLSGGGQTGCVMSACRFVLGFGFGFGLGIGLGLGQYHRPIMVAQRAE